MTRCCGRQSEPVAGILHAAALYTDNSLLAGDDTAVFQGRCTGKGGPGSVRHGFRHTTPAAAVKRNEAPLLAVETVVFLYHPHVKTVPAQGLAPGPLRGRWFPETNNVTHSGIAGRRIALQEPLVA